MWSQVTEEQIKKIKYEFFSDMVIMAIIIYMLYLSIEYQKNCGIPVKEWLIGITIIYFTRSTWQLIKIQVLTHFYDYRTYYDCTAFTISNGALVGWIIYGYVLFYSENNDCDKN